MTKKHVLIVLSLLLLISLLPLSSVTAVEGPEELKLAKDGKTHYQIYVGTTENPVVQHAAEELSTYLEEITGAEFEIIQNFNAQEDQDPPKAHLIVVGRHNDLTEKICPDISYEGLGEDGFTYCTAGQRVVVTGAEPRGTLYGVYYMLDRLFGVKWFAQDYTHIPDEKDLVIETEKLNQTHTAHYEFREILAADVSDPQYRQHNLLNGQSPHFQRMPVEVNPGPEVDTWSEQFADQHHSVHTVVPPEKYQETHPEYFSGRQIAFMNEEVRTIATEYFENKIANMIENEKLYENNYFGLSPMDGGWRPWNRTAESKAFAKEHGGAMSAPVLDMVLDVANRVRGVYPEAKFSTLAYQFTFTPPTGIKVPDYVQITAAPLHTNVGKSLVDPENRRDVAKDLLGWAEISNNILVWDYIVKFRDFLQPTPNIFVIPETLQGLAEYPAFKGYMAQGANHMLGWPFAELRTWVAARLLWNPDQEADAVIDEFLEGYYGDAASYIREYLEIMDENFDKTDSVLRSNTEITAPYLDFDTMVQADELFEKAEAAVADQPDYLKHVQSERIEVDYTILLRRQTIDKANYAEYAASKGLDWDTATQQRLDRFKAGLETAGVTKLDKRGALTLEELYLMMDPPKPQIVKDLGLEASEWFDYQQNYMITKKGGILTDDPKASDKRAASMPGDINAWGIRFDLSHLFTEGDYKLYAIARVDPGNGSTDDMAFRFGVNPGNGLRIVNVEEVADGEYHAFELPGVYQKGDQTIWFQPPNSDAIETMYVDRIIAVKANQ